MGRMEVRVPSFELGVRGRVKWTPESLSFVSLSENATHGVRGQGEDTEGLDFRPRPRRQGWCRGVDLLVYTWVPSREVGVWTDEYLTSVAPSGPVGTEKTAR